jgi:hypothetical protein
MTPFITISRTGISIATDQTDGFQRLGEGWLFNWPRVFFWGNEIFWNQVKVMVIPHCDCSKCQHLLTFKWYGTWISL